MIDSNGGGGGMMAMLVSLVRMVVVTEAVIGNSGGGDDGNGGDDSDEKSGASGNASSDGGRGGYDIDGGIGDDGGGDGKVVVTMLGAKARVVEVEVVGVATMTLVVVVMARVVGASWKAVFPVDEKEREKNVEASLEALQFLENEIKDKKFFGGEEFGLVDIAAVFIAFWIPIIQEIARLQLFTREKFPKLYKGSQEFMNHPVVKEVLPPRDPLFAFFKARYESLAASK
ncbi:glutathione S-transferase [Spatholobus suberectus]|nr:glutathione S-transferase [Spatholobus suberectus]